MMLGIKGSMGLVIVTYLHKVESHVMKC